MGCHVTHRLVHRPGALLLAQVHVVLHHAALARVELQALLERGLGLGVAALRFQQPAQVVPGMHLQVRCRVGGNHCPPFGQRGLGLAGALQQMAQVEPCMREVGLQRHCGAVSGLGLGRTQLGTQQGAQVEAGHMAHGRRAVRDPALVQRHGGVHLPGLLQVVRGIDQLTQAQTRDVQGSGLVTGQRSGQRSRAQQGIRHGIS